MRVDSVGYYPVLGEKYPGVTSILDYALGLPPALMDWATKKGALKLLEELKAKKKQGKWLNQKEAVSVALSARQELLKEAQAKGLAVHSAVEKVLGGDTGFTLTDDEHQQIFEQFLLWQQNNQLKPIFQEKFVLSRKHQFAGRLDFYGELYGQKVLIDFKTSNTMKPEYGLQLAAYKQCLIELGFPVERTYVLYLKPNDVFLVEYSEGIETFLKVKDIFEWKVSRHSPEWRIRMPEKEVTAAVAELTPTDKDKVVA